MARWIIWFFSELAYIAYRGTSDSLIEWRENCNMSFEHVPAPIGAAAYLNEVIAASDTSGLLQHEGMSWQKEIILLGSSGPHRGLLYKV